METNPAFNKYMDQYFEYSGHWDCPSKCGLRVIRRKDGKTLAIATEIYRQNPGTPVTEVVDKLATRVLEAVEVNPEHFIFVEHTPDLGSKLAFYNETFDRVTFEWNGSNLVNPTWTRLNRDEIDRMMEE